MLCFVNATFFLVCDGLLYACCRLLCKWGVMGMMVLAVNEFLSMGVPMLLFANPSSICILPVGVLISDFGI